MMHIKLLWSTLNSKDLQQNGLILSVVTTTTEKTNQQLVISDPKEAKASLCQEVPPSCTCLCGKARTGAPCCAQNWPGHPHPLPLEASLEDFQDLSYRANVQGTVCKERNMKLHLVQMIKDVFFMFNSSRSSLCSFLSG